MYYSKKVKLEEAIQNVKAGKWIGEWAQEKGIVEIIGNNIPILSAGCNENLYYDVPEDQVKNLLDVGIKVLEDGDKKKYCFINTNKDYSWLSICNFRRYGWCFAPERNAEYGYSGIIFANGDATFTSLPDEDEKVETVPIFLAVELARLVGKLQQSNRNMSTVLDSHQFKEGCLALLDEASRHMQTIYKPGISKNVEFVDHRIYDKETSGI